MSCDHPVLFETGPEKTRGTSFLMTTSFDSVAMFSGQELLDYFEALVVRDRRTTAELLIAIAEIDERKLWAGHACSSMFTFCMERFHMSEQVTAKRLWAARTARRFPVILEMVERGELHLGAIHLLARHLTADNHVRVLERAKHRSSREVERLIAELEPRADVASRIRAMPGPRGASAQVSMTAVAADEGFANRNAAFANRDAASGNCDAASANCDAASCDAASGNCDAASENRCEAPASRDEIPENRDEGSDESPGNRSEVAGAAGRRSSRTTESGTAAKPIVPLSPRRYKIEITVDDATHDKLRSLQDLLSRSATGRDPAAIISRAIDVLLARTLMRKAGCTERPRAAAAPTSPRERQNRANPAAVRREVWRRDCGRCCFLDARGRRCSETSNVEFHHREPFAMGGRHTPENVELRCAAHNQYQADLDFGRSFMDVRRGKSVSDSTFPGECQATAAAP
jgi:hypothetical protein